MKKMVLTCTIKTTPIQLASFGNIERQVSPILLPLRETVAHEPKPVAAVVLEMEILRPETLQDLLVVQDAPGVHGSDAAVLLVVLVP